MKCKLTHPGVKNSKYNAFSKLPEQKQMSAGPVKAQQVNAPDSDTTSDKLSSIPGSPVEGKKQSPASTMCITHTQREIYVTFLSR